MRASIDVALEPDAALEHVAARFEAEGGWTVHREQAGLMIETRDPKAGLLEPRPEVVSLHLPETLAVRVEARPLAGGGCRVSARIVRHRVGMLVGAVVVDLVGMIFGASMGAVIHGLELLEHREARRGAKRRMIRLAIEPLVPHQGGHERGPFRRGV